MLTDEQLLLAQLREKHVLYPDATNSVNLDHNETVLIPELRVILRCVSFDLSCKDCRLDSTQYCIRVDTKGACNLIEDPSDYA